MSLDAVPESSEDGPESVSPRGAEPPLMVPSGEQACVRHVALAKGACCSSFAQAAAKSPEAATNAVTRAR